MSVDVRAVTVPALHTGVVRTRSALLWVRRVKAAGVVSLLAGAVLTSRPRHRDLTAGAVTAPPSPSAAAQTA